MSFELPGATGSHDHGTRGRYVKGCRCSECRAANTAAYHAREALSKELAAEIPRSLDGICGGVEGRPCPRATKLRSDSAPICADCRRRLSWNGLVDAKAARKHLRALSLEGVGYKSVAAASDTGKSTLQKIMSGEKKRIRKSTSDAILSVDLDAVADHGFVPAGPTWRMLEELRPEYLTYRALATALGYKSQGIQLGKKRVLARTEQRVKRFYQRVFPDRMTG